MPRERIRCRFESPLVPWHTTKRLRICRRGGTFYAKAYFEGVEHVRTSASSRRSEVQNVHFEGQKLCSRLTDITWGPVISTGQAGWQPHCPLLAQDHGFRQKSAGRTQFMSFPSSVLVRACHPESTGSFFSYGGTRQKRYKQCVHSGTTELVDELFPRHSLGCCPS